jgi:proteic killer suppression protein
MIRSFRNKLMEELAAGKAPKRIPRDLADRAVRRLMLLDAVTRLDDLRVLPGNKLEAVDPQWFMNMQSKYDLHVQSERLAAELAAIEPRSAA